ncbi:MAG: GWxTD domain-containing protein [Bryobacteraceae bacterium]
MDLGSVTLWLLVDSSVKALLLAALAQTALWLGGVRSVSIIHAVWTVTLGAMLLLPFLLPLVPDLPIQVLPPRQLAPHADAMLIVDTDIVSTGTAAVRGGLFWYSQLTWKHMALGVYGLGLLVMLGRLLFGCVLMRRLARSCIPVRDVSATALLERHAGVRCPPLLESPGLLVPATTGALAPRILLPAGWRGWDGRKLEATLVHELAHVRRRDPLIALISILNKSVFWFHPLAWWLERKLALLAEQAADDSTLLAVGDRCAYASSILEMALVAGVKPGRLRWEAVSMASRSELRRRIDRLLDESLRLSPGVGAGRWLAMCGLGAVVLSGVAALRVEAAPALAGKELPIHYQRWLDQDVGYIISDEERSALLQLKTDEERAGFIEQFWLKRDPTPGTAPNEFKEEHYRRIAYSNSRFPWSLPGWRSDRGRIYIILGPPDEIESHPDGSQGSPPYEIWRYRWVDKVGHNVELRFNDPMYTGEYRLQPDARTQHLIPAGRDPAK